MYNASDCSGDRRKNGKMSGSEGEELYKPRNSVVGVSLFRPSGGWPIAQTQLWMLACGGAEVVKGYGDALPPRHSIWYHPLAKEVHEKKKKQYIFYYRTGVGVLEWGSAIGDERAPLARIARICCANARGSPARPCGLRDTSRRFNSIRREKIWTTFRLSAGTPSWA